jgi:hypothetical protein
MTPAERDAIARMVVLEAGNQPDDGQQAVAHVILNRVSSGRYGGRSAEAVIAHPGAFEPYATRRSEYDGMDRSSPAYQRAVRNVEVATRSVDITGGATHFYSPTAQRAMGRPAPAWDDGQGQNIGQHRFFAPEGRVGRDRTATAAGPIPMQLQYANPNTIAWDDEPRGQAQAATIQPAASAPAAPAVAAPAAAPAATPALAIKWDDEATPAAPPARPEPPAPEPALDRTENYGETPQFNAPVPQPRPANAPLAPADIGSTFAAVAPQPTAAPLQGGNIGQTFAAVAPQSPGALAAPNLDQTFAQFRTAPVNTAGDGAPVQQQSIPEITVRPPDSQTARQRYQLEQEKLNAERSQSLVGRNLNNLDIGLRGLARGVNPFMDDTAAFLGTVTGGGQGATFSERYRDNLARERGINAANDTAAPVVSYGTQLAGGLALPVGRLAEPANALVRFGRGAGIGAGYGAAYGFGAGDSLEDRATKAATGAAVGAAVGGPLNALVGARVPQNAIASTRPNSAEVVAAAERQGIQVPRIIATDSTAMQRTGQTVRNVPLAGDPIVRNTDRMVQQMGGRLDDLAGQVPTREAVGGAVRSSIGETVGTTMPQRAEQLYSRVEQLLPPGQVYPLASTQNTVQSIVGRNQAAALGDGTIQIVQEALARPGGLTYQGLRDLRSRIGEMTKFGATPQGASNAELKQLYGALSQDIDAAVSSAGPQAQRAYSQANQWFQGWAQRRETLGRILNSQSDEGIINQIRNAASSRASADIWKLSTARKAVGNDEWNDVAASVVQSLGRDAEGNFSPARFVTDYGNLSERGKDLLFRATGNRQLATALDDIATIASRAKEVQRFGNPSGTAQNTVGVGTLAAMAVDPITTISGVVGANVMSRILSAPATASSAARWSRAYQAAVQTPTAATFAGLQIASRNFASTLGDKLGVTVDPTKLFQPAQNLLIGRRPIAAEGDEAPSPERVQ